MAIGYVTNRYPAVSNTFILREIQALRALGSSIETFSVRRPRDGDLLAEADRAESARTSYLLPAGARDLLRAHVTGLMRHPRRYLGTLALALRLAAPGLRARLWQVLYFGEAILLWHRCLARQVDHLHAHFAYVASDDALLAAHMGGWSWSFSMHGPPEFSDVIGTRLAGKVESASAVVCISDFCRSQLFGLVGRAHWAKLRVVRCGVDPAAFPACDRVRPPDQPVNVLTVARLARVKGHAILLHAIAELANRGISVRATFVGDGPERAGLAGLAERLGVSDCVTMVGAVGQDDIRRHYEAADIFCLPSFAEGLPVVLMEAMAMNLPVLGTSIMGVPELVENEVSGLLVRPGRSDQLADALERLVASPALRARLGEHARQKVLADHHLDITSRQLQALYRELGVAG